MSRPSRSATTILGDCTTVNTMKTRRVDAVTPKRLAMRMSTHVLVRRFVGSHRGCICCIVTYFWWSGRGRWAFAVIYGRVAVYIYPYSLRTSIVAIGLTAGSADT